MATAKKKPAAKSAPSKADKAAANIPTPRPVAADPQFPEIHPSRHAASGLQELPTAGAPDQSAINDSSSGAGSMQVSTDPQPGIGVTHSGKDGTAKLDVSAIQGQDYVWSYEQALALPVAEKGTPLKAPSESQLKSLRSSLAKEQGEASVEESGDDREDAKARTKAVKDAEKSMESRTPIVAFKDKYRRTMLVAKGEGGLVAIPAPNYKDVAVPA